jgi:hypothetical protein
MRLHIVPRTESGTLYKIKFLTNSLTSLDRLRYQMGWSGRLHLMFSASPLSMFQRGLAFRTTLKFRLGRVSKLASNPLVTTLFAFLLGSYIRGSPCFLTSL